VDIERTDPRDSRLKQAAADVKAGFSEAQKPEDKRILALHTVILTLTHSAARQAGRIGYHRTAANAA
jgi:hypothetical protein